MSAAAPVVVWFRNDLRLDDHPALDAAVRTGQPVLACYVLEPAQDGAGVSGGAESWWLHHSLLQLGADLKARGSRLILRRGPAWEVVPELVTRCGATEVCRLRRWSPGGRRIDAAVDAALEREGVATRDFAADLLAEPGDVATGQGTPYRVFTPFWQRLQRRGDPPAPRPAPTALRAPAAWPPSLAPADLDLLPRVDWAAGLRAAWTPGAAGAVAAWAAFRSGFVADYAEGRDRPGAAGTSRLSPHLRFGEISVRRLWHDLTAAGADEGAESWLRQLAWRDFGHHLLHHFPRTLAEPLDARFEAYTWRNGGDDLVAWQAGGTGYPLVDAGMRELWATGWMHNRVRMVAASFLAKHLLLPWQEGAAWFADTLVDHDPANNTLGWQWTAGCGADAAPFFRIFNPVAQGRRFDPAGGYIARWLPELAGLTGRWRHAPWEAPASDLRAAGVILGENYPRPMVEHGAARARALSAWDDIKRIPR